VHQVGYFCGVFLLLAAGVNGATLVFSTNPLAGVPDTGGQIINGAGGGPVFSFNPLADVIAFDPTAFGVNVVTFANGNTTDPGFPMSGLTVAIVQNATAARAVATAGMRHGKEITELLPQKPAAKMTRIQRRRGLPVTKQESLGRELRTPALPRIPFK
jgi:hypothetical protein